MPNHSKANLGLLKVKLEPLGIEHHFFLVKKGIKCLENFERRPPSRETEERVQCSSGRPTIRAIGPRFEFHVAVAPMICRLSFHDGLIKSGCRFQLEGAPHHLAELTSQIRPLSSGPDGEIFSFLLRTFSRLTKFFVRSFPNARPSRRRNGEPPAGTDPAEKFGILQTSLKKRRWQDVWTYSLDGPIHLERSVRALTIRMLSEITKLKRPSKATLLEPHC